MCCLRKLKQPEQQVTLGKKATMHQVTTMLATSKNVLFALPRAIIKVLGHQHWWLAGGYDLETYHFYRWLAWWLPGG